VRSEQLPTLELRAPDGWSATAGEGSAEVELRASRFELFRSFGGRRSLDQIRAMDWSADPEPYLATFFVDTPLVPPKSPLIE